MCSSDEDKKGSPGKQRAGFFPAEYGRSACFRLWLAKRWKKTREFFPRNRFSCCRENIWLTALAYGALRSLGLLTSTGVPLVSEAMTLGELVRSDAEINSARPAPANFEPQT